MSNEAVLPINNIIPPALQSDKLPSNNESVKPDLKSEENNTSKLDSTRWAHLTKKEAALVKDRELLKKEKEAFQLEKERVEGIDKRAKEFEELKTKDKIAAMKLAGFTEEDIINFISAPQDTTSPEEKAAKIVKSELDKYREEQKLKEEEFNKQQQKLKEEEHNKVLTKFKSDIASYVNNDKNSYEYCNFYGEPALELIYDTVAKVLQDDQEVISIKEASDLVESFYEEQDKAMNSLKKRSYKSKEELKESAQPELNISSKRVASKQYVDTKIPTKTLPNKIGSSLPVHSGHLSPEDNRQRVIEKYTQMFKK